MNNSTEVEKERKIFHSLSFQFEFFHLKMKKSIGTVMLLIQACFVLNVCMPMDVNSVNDSSNTTICENLGPGYYCVDEAVYIHCTEKDDGDHDGKTPLLQTCRYPLVCNCGKSTSSSPCSWPFIRKKASDCLSDPGEFLSLKVTSKQKMREKRASETMKHVVSYFDNWSQYHTATLGGKSCRFLPANIDGSYTTNIIYAFAIFDNSFKVKTYEWNDEDLYAQVMEKKKQYPHLKVSIAIGGWNFNVREETKHLFSEMASTQANRAKFISSAIAFAHKYSFDGIDIDWEYPAVASQGGQPRDTENFSLLIKEFREAINADKHPTKLLLTIASPAGESKIKLIQFDRIHPYGLLPSTQHCVFILPSFVC